MERNREARKLPLASSASASGLSRRRHRAAGSLRDSPEKDGHAAELPEVTTGRLRDRGGSLKRDRDRDREKDHRMSNRIKRRGHREDGGGDEGSDESVNDDEEDDGDDVSGRIRMASPTSNNHTKLFLSSSLPNNHHHFHSVLQHRKSYQPPATAATKLFRASPATVAAATWKTTDEMIGVSVPRKARSASTKRSHESWASSAEQVHQQASPSPAPASPSSSNASLKKKMKANNNGHEQRPPKSSSPPGQDEIEIEIAEVLYGMMRQPLGPSKQEISENDSMEASNNKVKSAASPTSNSQFAQPQSSPLVTAIAPKRKIPRPVKYEEEHPSFFPPRSSPVRSAAKAEPAETEASPHNPERNSGPAAENGTVSFDLSSSQVARSQPKPGLKALSEEQESPEVRAAKAEPQSTEMESQFERRLDHSSGTKGYPIAPEIEKQREKFQIDLMAPPPLKSSPERDGEIQFVAVDPKPVVTAVEVHEEKSLVKEDEKAVKNLCKENVSLEPEENKMRTVEDAVFRKLVVSKEKTIDLRLDLEKSDVGGVVGSLNGNKLNHHGQKQQQQQPSIEKNAQSSSVPPPLSMARWPGGLAPMGYMAPLQGVVSVDGNALPSTTTQPPLMLFNQPRPKRCATHCYIARNILYYQQFTKMNPFWPAAAGSAPLYAAKQCNLHAIPSSELQGGILGRGFNSIQDKNHQSSENVPETARGKQILLQQALPPGASNNILHGPTFIFPLSQQYPPAAAGVRPGSAKSPPAGNNTRASSGASNSTSVNGATSITSATPAAMSFNYPNVPPSSETQYLAILQNNAYPFPIPAHVGAPSAYRGDPTQAMPFFNGPFYSSHMFHPLHLQQQQQNTVSQQSQQQGHQNPSISSGSSASQKNLQNQLQRPGLNGGNSKTFQGLPTQKNQSSQLLQFQQRHSDAGGKDSLSTADTRVCPASLSIYSHNFAMQMQPPNFGMMATTSIAGTQNGSRGEKKQKQPQQSQQQQGSKPGVEPLSSQGCAMPFSSINGASTPPGFDMASVAQSHAILNSLPEAARQGYQMMATAVAAKTTQQTKNSRASEDAKCGANDASNLEEERKAAAITGKGPPATSGQSIAFSRSDTTNNVSAPTTPGSNVIDSSARALNLSSAPWGSASVTFNPPASHQHMQRNQHQQQQQIMQFPKQQQFAATARSKGLPTSNGSVYSDHLPPPMSTKFPNAISGLAQNIVQTSGSPVQSPQWKNSVRISITQASSPSLPSSTSSLKSLPKQQQQQEGQSQQTHPLTQVSFVSNPKNSSTPQAQQAPNSNKSPSPPTGVGSPSTSSISRSAGGSPKTTSSTSAGSKGGQASPTLSSQPTKNSPSVLSQKPSILGNPHSSSPSSTGTKSQFPLQQHQLQQLPKHAMQQAQLFFSSAYMQHQAHQPTTYLQRQRNEPQGPSSTSSAGMLSFPPVTVASNSYTSDPAKAIAAATATNMKNGSLQTHGHIHGTEPLTAVQSPGKKQ